MDIWFAVDALDYGYVVSNLQHLPTIRHLLDGALWGPCEPEIHACAPSWATVFTGLSAQNHGIDSLYKSIVCDSPQPAIWEMVERAGLPVGVYRVPCTYPPERLNNGWFFSGWTAPYPACWPNNDQFYHYLVDTLSCDGSRMLAGTPYVANLVVSSFNKSVDALKKLLVKHPVALAIIGLDVLQLLQWHVWDTASAVDVAKDRLAWYRRIDGVMGTLLKICSPRVVCLTSDHGDNGQPGLYAFNAVGQETRASIVQILPTAMKVLGMRTTLPMDGDALI